MASEATVRDKQSLILRTLLPLHVDHGPATYGSAAPMEGSSARACVFLIQRYRFRMPYVLHPTITPPDDRQNVRQDLSDPPDALRNRGAAGASDSC